MTKAITGLSINLHTGMDYLYSLPIEQLNEIADTVNRYAEEVEKGGQT